MSKEMIFDAEARDALCRGFSQLAEAVRVTLGPKGRHVALETRHGLPALTADAALIAREIQLADPFENMGAQLGREIQERAHAEAGDGGTTATVLAHAMILGGRDLADRGANPVALKRGMEAAVQEVLQNLRGSARRDRVGFGMLADEDRRMALRIYEAIEHAGNKGVVSICSSDSEEDEPITPLPGCRLEQGYLSPYFVTEPNTMECRLEDVWILLMEGKVEEFAQLVPLLEQVAGSGKSLLIVAEDVTAEVLATLVVNSLRGSLKVAAVNAPGWGRDRGHRLRDLAVLTGGKVFGPSLEGVHPQDLGWAQRVNVTKTATTLRGTGGDAAEVRERVRDLQSRLTRGLSTRRRRLLTQRIDALESNVVLVPVGGPTASEAWLRRNRYKDLLLLVRAVREEGVVAGGGLALIRAGATLPATAGTEEEQGAALVRAALSVPLAQIAANAGWDPEEVLYRISRSEPTVGFDASAGAYQDLFSAGVVDASRVTRCALNYAVSMAGMILTTETLVADVDDEDDHAA